MQGYRGLVALLLITPAVGLAEIEKFADPSPKGFHMYWWPKLPHLKAWHQDKEMSKAYTANCLAPNGSTFVNSLSVIDAKACYKPKEPESRTLDQFIRNDEKSFRESEPNLKITEIAPLSNGDGQKLRTVRFVPSGKGNWEEVCYGEEGDFYIVFSLSSRSRAGFDAALPAFHKLVSRYKE